MLSWIVVRHKRLPYISGIFASDSEAEAHFARMPSEIRGMAFIETRPEASIPCCFIEDRGHFRCLSFDEAERDLRDLATKSNPDEGVYAILYIVRHPFRPSAPGRDEMGSMNHVHLDPRSRDAV